MAADRPEPPIEATQLLNTISRDVLEENRYLRAVALAIAAQAVGAVNRASVMQEHVGYELVGQALSGTGVQRR